MTIAGLLVDAGTTRSRLERYVRLNLAAIQSDYMAHVDDRDRQARAGRVLTSVANGVWEATNLDSLSEVLYFSGRQREGAEFGLLFPLYDVNESFEFNARFPSVGAPPSQPRVPSRSWSLMGRSIGFPIGVPASALTSSVEGIALLARSGYNVLTFKTVRSRAFDEGYALPNWVFLPEESQPIDLGALHGHRVVADRYGWVSGAQFSSANSFGVPSSDPQVWQEQVAQARNVLTHEQLLLVSVMGTVDQGDSSKTLALDYVKTARLAEEAGSEFIELNLSCPNTLDRADGGMRPPICDDVPLATSIVRQVREALRPETRIVIKLAYMQREPLNALVHSVSDFVDGICGINSMATSVVDADGDSLFPGRPTAGLSGVAIRQYSLDFTRQLVELRAKMDASFDIIATGGVTDVESFRELYAAGATVVQSASGVALNRDLAADSVRLLGDRLPETPVLDGVAEDVYAARVLQFVRDAGIAGASEYVVAAQMSLPLRTTWNLLARLAAQKTLRVRQGRHGVRTFFAG